MNSSYSMHLGSLLETLADLVSHEEPPIDSIEFTVKRENGQLRRFSLVILFLPTGNTEQPILTKNENLDAVRPVGSSPEDQKAAEDALKFGGVPNATAAQK